MSSVFSSIRSIGSIHHNLLTDTLIFLALDVNFIVSEPDFPPVRLCWGTNPESNFCLILSGAVDILSSVPVVLAACVSNPKIDLSDILCSKQRIRMMKNVYPQMKLF